jgi:predicted transcriptional regulator
VAQQKDLKRVGQWLRARRTEQHIARTDLARRVGVSPTYLWMVEEARERASGEASQPSQFLLRQLATELGMTERESHDLLRLAGYTPIEDGPVALMAPLSSDEMRTGPSKLGLQGMLSRQRVLGLLDALRQEILGADLSDERVLPRFGTDVTVFSPESQLADALHLMDEQRYSQVVVRDGARLRLLSSEGIVRCLLAEELEPFTDLRIGNVLTLEPPDTVSVVSASSTIGEVMTAFVEQPSLVSILVTATGNQREAPLGIITTWDLVDAVHERVDGA